MHRDTTFGLPDCCIERQKQNYGPSVMKTGPLTLEMKKDAQPLSDIEVFFHPVHNKNNYILTAPENSIYYGYMIDSNVLVYLEMLIEGRIPLFSPLYYQLLKLCFVITKPFNIVHPMLALCELARNDVSLPFSRSTLNYDRLVSLVRIVLQCQALHASSAVDYCLRFDQDKLQALIRRYQGDNIDEAAVNFLDGFPEALEKIAPLFNLKIDGNLEYLKLCYDAHMDVVKGHSQKSKVRLFVERLSDKKLPYVTKTFNFCLRVLSDSLSNGDLQFKYGKINGYRAIGPAQMLNTAVDLVISDFAYLIHLYEVDNISYLIKFVTSDRIAFVAEDEIATCMIGKGEGLPTRLDIKPEFEYLSKADKILVEEFLSEKVVGFVA